MIERRLNRQWKLPELSMKCACHSAHFSQWKVAEIRISVKTEMCFFSCVNTRYGPVPVWRFQMKPLEFNMVLCFLFKLWFYVCGSLLYVALLVSKTTDIRVFDWLTLYKHCTILYRTLIYTIHYCISLYVSFDLYCTALNNAVRFYWHALYSIEQHCTFLLTSTV